MTQEQALAIMKTGANVFLTGEPGSGKTHTINRYVAHLRAHGIEPAVTASTGIAATHIGGMTVHSWSGIGIKAALSRYDLDRIVGNERVFKRLAKARVLVIDEISMLDARTLGMVDAVCREVRRNKSPFGGLQTVFVGDFFQLPPVNHAATVPAKGGPASGGQRGFAFGGGGEQRSVEFAFLSAAWSRLRPVVCYLTEQHRQDDPEFLALLSAIRSDAVGDEHVRALEARASARDASSKDAVKLFSHNSDVDRVNDAELDRLTEKARAFAMQTSGPEHLVDSLKRGCLSPEELRLKQGAAVMFTRNDPRARFVNGTLGTVVGFGKETGVPNVRTRDGARIEAEPMEWRIEDQGQALASVRQVPLRLAWAMTIHKSQGMSLDAAVMDLGSAFEFGQGYVALSRVRRLSGLFLLGCNERALKVHPDILAQDRVFRAESQTAEEESARFSSEERAEIENAFIVACGGKKGVAQKKSCSVSDIRVGHPKAYARWSDQEEGRLAELFYKGTPVKEIARRLERKRGGITSRLKKIGLIDEDFGR